MKLSDAEKAILKNLWDKKPVPGFRPDDETPYSLRIKRLAMHDLLEFTGVRQDLLEPALSPKGQKLAADLD